VTVLFALFGFGYVALAAPRYVLECFPALIALATQLWSRADQQDQSADHALLG
jgi:hypothetical protein